MRATILRGELLILFIFLPNSSIHSFKGNYKDTIYYPFGTKNHQTAATFPLAFIFPCMVGPLAVAVIMANMMMQNNGLLIFS